MTKTSTRDRWLSRCPSRVVLLAAVTVVMCASAAGTAVAKPRLAIVTQTPVTVRGAGFQRHESVRLRLLAPGLQMVRRLRATRAGRFSVSFAGAAPDRCAGYSIVATGASGSLVTLRWPVRRGCPPA
jgi:hypothetical protein